MKKTYTIIILMSWMILAGAGALQAQEAGRYQALKMNETSIFILDTKEGHMWLQSVEHAYDTTQSGLYLYLGTVEVGKSPLLEYKEKLEREKKLNEEERIARERESNKAIEEELEKIRKRKEEGEVKELILKR
jgi:hypothetical protein